MRRIPVWLYPVVLVAGVGVVGFVMASLPTGKVAVQPHAPMDLNGRIRVDGRAPEPIHGRMMLLGVQVQRLSMLQRELVRLDPRVTVTTDPNAGREVAERRRDREAVRNSKKIASAVAFSMLGEQSRIRGNGATVVHVDSDGPARGLLQPVDRIVRVNGKPVVTSVSLIQTISRMRPGTPVRLGVRRDRRPRIVEMRTVPPVPGDRIHRSRIGVEVYTSELSIELPHRVRISATNVVGPSAGLAFALAIYDMQSRRDLARGRYVAATGELTLEGQVLPVGGVRQKAISAEEEGVEILLVPTANVMEARSALEKLNCASRNSCPKVIGVASAREAVEVLSLNDAQLDRMIANS